MKGSKHFKGHLPLERTESFMNFPDCNRAVYLDFNGFSIWLINELRSG